MKLKKNLILSVVVILLTGIVINNMAMAADKENYLKMSFNIKYLERDKSTNLNILSVNVSTNKLGRLAYVEEYYSAGSDVPKLYSTKRFYDDNLTKNKISFNISRPTTRLGKPYSLIKSIILLDGKIVGEKWLDTLASTKFEIENTNISLINEKEIANISYNKDRATVTTAKPTAVVVKSNELNISNNNVGMTDEKKMSVILMIFLIIFIIYIVRRKEER